MGVSVRGASRVSSSWNDPAQASRFVRKLGSPKRCLMVAGIDECSNCDVGVGAAGS
jgi:hypothetical protein